MKTRTLMKSMICTVFITMFAVGCGTQKPETPAETETNAVTEAVTEETASSVSEQMTEAETEAEITIEIVSEEVLSYPSWEDAYFDVSDRMSSGEGIFVVNGSGEDEYPTAYYDMNCYCFYDINQDAIPELICMPGNGSENYYCFTFSEDNLYLFEVAGKKPRGMETICHVKDTKYYLTRDALARETRLCTVENGECKVVLHAYSPEWMEKNSKDLYGGNYTMCYLDEEGNKLTKEKFQEAFQNLTGYSPFDLEDFSIEENWMQNMDAYTTEETMDGDFIVIENVPSTDPVYYSFDQMQNSIEDWNREMQK